MQKGQQVVCLVKRRLSDATRRCSGLCLNKNSALNIASQPDTSVRDELQQLARSRDPSVELGRKSDLRVQMDARRSGNSDYVSQVPGATALAALL